MATHYIIAEAQSVKRFPVLAGLHHTPMLLRIR
jgi:hypothetical protein